VAWEHGGAVAIAGIGFSPIERRTSVPLGQFARQAMEAACADCGIEVSDIDGLATYATAPNIGARNQNGVDIINVDFFLSDPRFKNVTWYAQPGLGLIASAVRDAAHALISGSCNYALIWRAMYTPPGTYGLYESQTAIGDAQFTAPYGCVSVIQWHAFGYRRYLELYGSSREEMAALVVNSRNNANRNEHAYFADRPLTEEEYLAARMISDPLCLFDCDVPVTSCAALVMTTSERAGHLRQPPAYLAAIGQQTVPRRDSIHYLLDDHIESGQPLAADLWRQAGLGPSDMAAAELYDGFSPSVYYWLEAAGFCARGEAHAFATKERIGLEGTLPVNTFGGSLSQGRLHGMGHIAEAALQVSGRAGQRQVSDAGAVCVFDGSPMYRGGGLVLTRGS
jgi:acetyl-CoA acetyltransferase